MEPSWGHWAVNCNAAGGYVVVHAAGKLASHVSRGGHCGTILSIDGSSVNPLIRTWPRPLFMKSHWKAIKYQEKADKTFTSTRGLLELNKSYSCYTVHTATTQYSFRSVNHCEKTRWKGFPYDIYANYHSVYYLIGPYRHQLGPVDYSRPAWSIVMYSFRLHTSLSPSFRSTKGGLPIILHTGTSKGLIKRVFQPNNAV